MVNKVRMGVVGSVGAIGGRHVQEIMELDSTDLIGVQDDNQAKANLQASELGVKQYKNLDDLLGDSRIDAISIATPHPSHHKIALKAFQAKKHVLSEKPISQSPSLAKEMIERAEAAGVVLGVVFQNRLRPELVWMKKMVQKGAIGRIYRTSLVCHHYRPQGYYNSAPWRGTWLGEGGGVLMNQAPHALDIFQWLGGMPSAVHGTVANLIHDIEVEDSAAAVVEYVDGGMGLIHCDTVQAPTLNKVEMWGDKGALLLDDNKLIHQRFDGSLKEFSDTDQVRSSKGPVAHIEEVNVQINVANHKDAVDDFAKALIEGRDPAVTGYEGAKSLELAAAIILSGSRRERVELPLDQDAYDDLLVELQGHKGLL